MQTVRLACRAMASRFELVLVGEDAAWLRAAGEEALAEIRRLDAELSRFRPASAVSRVNARAADAPVRVAPSLFDLLLRSRRLYEQTGGAFDVTVGPLMRCWGFGHGTGRVPDARTLRAARARTGMHLVELDANRRTVAFARPGVEIDLGAIGKGHAADEAVRRLRELGVRRAFLHGGTSTIAALGRPDDDDDDAWKVALETPPPSGSGEAAVLHQVVPLVDAALSVSAVWGRSFEAGGRRYGHVLDPRCGRPVHRALMAAVAAPSATDADALSTALLVAGPAGLTDVARAGPDRRALVVTPGPGGRDEVHRHGWTAAAQFPAA